jgi:hypothetical protein
MKHEADKREPEKGAPSLSQRREQQVTPPGLKPWDRTLSFSDSCQFELCELGYFKRKNRERKAPRDVHQIIGDLTHRATAKEEGEGREADLARQLDRLPEETRVEAERIVRELIENDDSLDEAGDEVHDQQKDRLLLRCAAPVPHWELVAKPDETGMVDGGRGRDVLQLLEKKTAFNLRKKAKDQVFFAGMVAQVGRALSYDGPVRLVIRLLRSKQEHVFWYSRSATERNMFRIASVIRRIEKAVETGEFKANTGHHCSSCAYRNGCEAFAAWKQSQEAQQSSPTPTPVEGNNVVGLSLEVRHSLAVCEG